MPRRTNGLGNMPLTLFILVASVVVYLHIRRANLGIDLAPREQPAMEPSPAVFPPTVLIGPPPPVAGPIQPIGPTKLPIPTIEPAPVAQPTPSVAGG